MNTTIQIFESSEFGKVRTMQSAEGEPLFCAKDVCDALGYKKTRNAIAQHVDEGDALKQGLIDSLGREQKAIFINESGLYALILGSKLESARRFKRWVTAEVLPAIRRQGGYMVARPTDTAESLMARAMQVMHGALERLGTELAQLRPRAAYADHVLDSISCLTTTQIAKELSMTGTELNRLLCQRGIQYGQSGQYMLYAKYARRGYAKSRTWGFHLANGELITRTYMVWTETGREFIHELLQNSKLKIER